MSIKEQYWKYSLIVIILFMGIIIFRQITPFLGGLLGALTIYILVRKQMAHLTERRKIKRSVAALLITAETVMVFLGTTWINRLAIGKQTSRYQSGPSNIHRSYAASGRVYQRKNRLRCIRERYHIIHCLHPSPHRTDHYGKHQQPCHQSVCHGIRTILYADRRKKNGGLCE